MEHRRAAQAATVLVMIVAAATSNRTTGLVLLGIVGGLLLLGALGFTIFTWTRRKRRPDQCGEQREALELAERSVKYWDAACAHLEAVEKERIANNEASSDESHASMLSKASVGLTNAIKAREQCQLDLIRCMAGGGPVPTTTQAPLEPLPFTSPTSDGSTSSN